MKSLLSTFFASLLTVAALPAVQGAIATPPAPVAAPRPVAIFTTVKISMTSPPNPVEVFTNDFTTKILSSGFTIIDPKILTNALSANTPANPNESAVDRAFADQTSALRLAQTVGAQYVLLLSLDSLGAEDRGFNGYGVNVIAKVLNLRASYRLCDATHGGALLGDSVTATTTIPSTTNLSVFNPDVVNQLMQDAATQLAESFVRKANNINLPSVAPEGPVEFSVTCTMGDLVIPDILRAPDGSVVVGPSAYTVSPVDVTVALNGAVVGSAPGTFKGVNGLSKLRLTREGFKDWENMVNLSPGFKLNVAMQMSDAGYARWQQSIGFLQSLKTNTKLTDAQVQEVLGIAQMFRQSGLRLDQRSDVKIDANQFPAIQQNYQSLFSAPPALPGVVTPPAK
jgi:hypothetical protein